MIRGAISAVHIPIRLGAFRLLIQSQRTRSGKFASVNSGLRSMLTSQ